MKLTEFFAEIERNYVIGFVGDIGDGKTISAISTLILFDALYKVIGKRKTILTNVPIKTNHVLLEYYDQLEHCEDTLIFIDEIHQNADSRQSMKGQNFFTSGITMDVRKFNNKLIWTSQESSQVEKRVRNRTLLFLHPRQIDALVFDIALTNVIGNAYDNVIINLNPFKDLYDTHYKPVPLMINDE